MLEMIKKYIGKDCIIYLIDGQTDGIIKEIEDGWLSVDNGKEIETINIDFVVRIKEFPINKKGKRKSIV